MNSKSAAPAIDIQRTFEAIPGNHIVLLPNAPTYTIVGATDSFLKMSYKTRDEIMGKSLFEVFPDNTTNIEATGIVNLKSSLESVIARKETHQMADQRYDIVNPKTGSYEVKVWSPTNKPVLSNDGAVEYIIHTTVDITEKVRLQEENTLRQEQLNESESRFRSMVEQAPVPILLSRGEEVVVESLNEPMLQLINKTSMDEVVGKRILDVLPELKDQEVLQILDNVQKTGVPFHGGEVPADVVIEGKRVRHYFNFSYTPLLEGGQIRGVMHVALDITQQVTARKKIEESEERFRSMADASPVMIWTLDEQGNSVYYNSRAREFTGQTEDDLQQGKTWQLAIHPEDIEMAGSLVSNAVKERIPYQMECRMRRADGAWRWLLNQGTPRLGMDGEYFGFVGSSIDITERKNAEQALKDSESRFRALVNASSDVIYRLNADWTIMYPLDGRRFLSDARAPIKNWMEKNVHPSEFDRVKKTVAAAIANKTVFELEHRVVTADGSAGWTFSRAVPLFDDAGSIVEWFGTATNITAQKMAEQASKESESRFRTMVEQAQVAIGMTRGRDIIYEVINAPMLELFGRTRADVLEKRIVDVFPELEGQGVLDILRNVWDTGQPFKGHEVPATLIVQGKPVEKYYNLSYGPVATEGKMQYIIHLAIDVTEQVLLRKKVEESREELQLALDAADLGTFRLDLFTNQATNSNKVNEWFGYTLQGYSREEGFNHIHPDDRKSVDEVILGTVQSEARSRHDVTYRVVHPQTGAVRHLRSHGKTMFNSEGKAYVVIGIIQDVTAQILHQHQLEENEALLQQRVLERTLELEKLNGELNRSNQNLEQFAYAASHDLKEPVRKIHFFTNQLKGQLAAQLNESQARAFNRIENATERMGNLIDDLLLYSHVSQRPHETETVDLNKKVQRVLEDLELDVEEKNAVITVEKLPVVQGYLRQLQQLFQNLISNALKYNKPDVAPQIHISASEVVEHGKRYHLIEIKDNGIGFEQQYADKIFQMFTRLHGKAEYSGTGVGLSIVKKVVENHNGFIKAESVAGEGSVFKIYLPV